MDEPNCKPREIPILTDVVRLEPCATNVSPLALTGLRAAPPPPDAAGYDPYNKAPPDPADDAKTD